MKEDLFTTWRSFAFGPAKASDVPQLYRFFFTEFGADTPSEERMVSWISACPTSFILGVGASELALASSERSIVGAYKVLPITSAAVIELEQGSTSGSKFEARHIAPTSERVAAYYIGDVYSPHLLLRGGLRRDMINRTVNAIGARIIPIYARPFTDQGWEAMHRHGFLQVSNGSSDLEIRALCKLPDGRRLQDLLSPPESTQEG